MSDTHSERAIQLFCREGSKDAVYCLQLIARRADGFVVNYQNGRRGGTLASGTKTLSLLPYASALKVYEKVIKEKRAKGYVPNGEAGAFQDGETAARVSGIALQLLNAIEADEADNLIENSDCFMQHKWDGERRALIITPDAVIGVNRQGLTVALPENVSHTARALNFAGETRLDGELVGHRLYVFDLLMIEGEDVRELPFADRLARLYGESERFQFDAVRLVATSQTADGKRTMFGRAKRVDAEGVVFKRRAAPYTAGRPASGGDALKHKFVASATVRVSARTMGKRSVAMSLIDNGRWVDVGNVTIPPNASVPAVGALIEVRYLYAFQGGSLFQPVYICERFDLDDAACTIGQIKYKAENQDDRPAVTLGVAA